MGKRRIRRDFIGDACGTHRERRALPLYVVVRTYQREMRVERSDYLHKNFRFLFFASLSSLRNSLSFSACSG